MRASRGKLAVVILTYNRRQEVLHTLERLQALREEMELCVVDNASGDGSAEAIVSRFPDAGVVRLERNLGAAGRNEGVRHVRADYVAFCDDDTWWTPGSLTRAVDLLEAHPRLAVITARVLVGQEERMDPASTEMAASPLPNVVGVPGTEVAGFMAGACVMRRTAFLQAGGYEPRFFIGGEEALLATDLMAAGWHLAYVPELVVHHHPSRSRDRSERRHLLLRNALWCAWLRRPLTSALRETRRRLSQALHEPGLIGAVAGALKGVPWVLQNRRVIPYHVDSRLRAVEERHS